MLAEQFLTIMETLGIPRDDRIGLAAGGWHEPVEDRLFWGIDARKRLFINLPLEVKKILYKPADNVVLLVPQIQAQRHAVVVYQTFAEPTANFAMSDSRSIKAVPLSMYTDEFLGKRGDSFSHLIELLLGLQLRLVNRYSRYKVQLSLVLPTPTPSESV